MKISRSEARVTIVTPSYNQGKFIRATIESVLGQDYPHLEYIVMDGGSTDQTSAIAAEYASRLTFISEKDRGQAHAINKGFSMAGGEIVAWLNSDDILLPGAVARAVKAFDESPPGVGGIYGDGYLMDRDGRMTRPFPATEPFNLWKLAYLSDYVLQQSAFFRRAAIAEVGWIDEGLHYALDWDLLIRLGKRFGLHYVPEYLGALREHPEAKTSLGGRLRIEEIRQVLERHTGLRHAPGYWTYNLEMHRSAWKDRLENRSPGWLQPPAAILSFLLNFATAVPIMLIDRHSQGFYRDRWAADRLKWMLPEEARQVIVRGSVPDEPRLSRQTLTVQADGRELGQWQVGPGAFDIRFPVPAGSRGPFRFEVHASRYKRPRLGSEASLRRMAWIVDTIAWTARGSEFTA
ncbi:MAG TPA: glycosyltransferase family 2 protein [Candidatus Acidoferrales bacterium]|nr:glycosyltransferase family 2 protein [Candidatus Acidoferrales bacterium]